MGLAALLQAVAALLAPPPAPPDPLADLSPRRRAALVVVSGLPAPRGVGGVIVREGEHGAPRPRGALVLVDQEGGETRAYPALAPAPPAVAHRSVREAYRHGRAAGRALRGVGVHVDLAPVLDLRGGPLGARHFAVPRFGIAFARGLERGGTAACVKHFPGLGAAPLSTDESPHVRGRLLSRELAAFRAAVRAGIGCVMTSHAFYGRFEGGARRASFAPGAYGLLRSLGFDGVAVTDSLSVFGSRWAVPAARRAARAGADLLLFTNGRDAARAIRALVPLARRGLLDRAVARVAELRRRVGLEPVPGW